MQQKEICHSQCKHNQHDKLKLYIHIYQHEYRDSERGELCEISGIIKKKRLRLEPLDLEQPHFCVVPDGRINISQIDDAPHVGPEPHGGACIGLVLPDENWVGNRQQAYQRSVLEEFQDFTLISKTLVNADLLHLWHKDLKEAHDSL